MDRDEISNLHIRSPPDVSSLCRQSGPPPGVPIVPTAAARRSDSFRKGGRDIDLRKDKARL
jgi:hypothetical protein